jgi:hypothetical protein
LGLRIQALFYRRSCCRLFRGPAKGTVLTPPEA